MKRLALLLPLLALAAASVHAAPSDAAAAGRKGWHRGACDGFTYDIPPAFRKADKKTLADMLRAHVLPGLYDLDSEIWFAGPPSDPKSAVIVQAQWNAGQTPEQITARMKMLLSLPKEAAAAGLGSEIEAGGWKVVSFGGLGPAKPAGLDGATASLSCKRGDGPETVLKTFFAASGNLTLTVAFVYRKEAAERAASVLKQVLGSFRAAPVPGLVREAKPAAALAPLPVATEGMLLAAEGDFEMRIPASLAPERPLPAGFREENGSMRIRLEPGRVFTLAETGKPEPAPGEIGPGRAVLALQSEASAASRQYAPTDDFPFIAQVGTPELLELARSVLGNQAAANRQAGSAIDPRLERMGLLSADAAEARTAAGGVRVVKLVGTVVWLHLRPARLVCYVVQNRARAYSFWCAWPVEEESKWEPLFDGAIGSIRPAAR